MSEDVKAKKTRARRKVRPLFLAIEVYGADGYADPAATSGRCVAATREESVLALVEKLGTKPGTIIVSVP